MTRGKFQSLYKKTYWIGSGKIKLGLQYIVISEERNRKSNCFFSPNFDQIYPFGGILPFPLFHHFSHLVFFSLSFLIYFLLDFSLKVTYACSWYTSCLAYFRNRKKIKDLLILNLPYTIVINITNVLAYGFLFNIN